MQSNGRAAMAAMAAMEADTAQLRRELEHYRLARQKHRTPASLPLDRLIAKTNNVLEPVWAVTRVAVRQ
jgi:hypothetical protein